MSWIDKLERKMKRYAIPNLMTYVIALNVTVFVLDRLTVPGRVIDLITLDPGRVLQGEVWRLITFAFIPPTLSLIWFVFTLYFYYLIGKGLEEVWGSFKFNLYYLIGILATVGATFFAGGVATSAYLYLSLFLAFAFIYPDYEILLFFIIPVKIKYLAWLDLAFIGFAVIAYPLSDKLAALAPLVAYLIFFGRDFWSQASLKRTVRRNRRQFISGLSKPRSVPFHRCAVCGKTELSHPKMSFRYCSTCKGNYEYCEEHLTKHKHVEDVR